MDTTERIFWTIIYVIGLFILPKMMDSTNDRLKERLNKTNPQLVKNQNWFFSKTKKKVLKRLIWVMIVIWIIFIWTTDIKILEQ